MDERDSNDSAMLCRLGEMSRGSWVTFAVGVWGALAAGAMRGVDGSSTSGGVVVISCESTLPMSIRSEFERSGVGAEGPAENSVMLSLSLTSVWGWVRVAFTSRLRRLAGPRLFDPSGDGWCSDEIVLGVEAEALRARALEGPGPELEELEPPPIVVGEAAKCTELFELARLRFTVIFDSSFEAAACARPPPCPLLCASFDDARQLAIVPAALDERRELEGVAPMGELGVCPPAAGWFVDNRRVCSGAACG